MSLFSRSSDLPGQHGTLRDCTPGGKGMRKFTAGDFAVINAADISRQEAQTLVDAEPGAVLNASRFTTGAIPNYGPHMLLDADVLLLEDLGEDFLQQFRDGKQARILDGEVLIGEKSLGMGEVLSRDRAEAEFTDAQQGLVDHMEAFFGNSTQFIHS